jgi:hypothetical protein
VIDPGIAPLTPDGIRSLVAHLRATVVHEMQCDYLHELDAVMVRRCFAPRVLQPCERRRTFPAYADAPRRHRR